eukprot:56762-Prymnesium_polylepis.1
MPPSRFRSWIQLPRFRSTCALEASTVQRLLMWSRLFRFFVSSNVETSVAFLDGVNVDGAEATTVEPPVPFASSIVETSGASPGVAK